VRRTILSFERPEAALVEGFRGLLERYSPSCFVSDVMERRRTLRSDIRPVVGGRFAGPAVTVKLYPGDLVDCLDALKVTEAGDVIVVDAAGETETSIWGGLMAGLCMQRGVAGAVVDGAIRDIDEIRDLGFPIFSRAVVPRSTHSPYSGRLEPIEVNVTITCGGTIVAPGDIVLLDRNCHTSHHYGMVLSGAHVVYLDAYPLNEYSMYGAVPIRSIKERLLELKRAGKLDRVKLVLLTNCTFDGIVYDVERVMEECLAIKPDLIFLWDEAWFAFAGFHPTYRRRTGMGAAARLRDRFRDPEFRQRYVQFKKQFGDPDDGDPRWLDTRLVPDPDRARIRVYVTHSTHKTLTALRQGSMIHVYDQDFKQKVEEAFHEAYMTHTSTSPNYQILASLDIGRRQVELEGYELVQKQVDHAMALRERIATHALLKKYFRFLATGDLIPREYRPSGIETYFDSEQRWARMEECWHTDEFVVDPTRLTLHIGATGIDGDTFKHDYLMLKYGIQINKTSRNTVLFMTNIGTTRSSVAYLIEILVKIAQALDERNEDMSPPERKLHQLKVESLTERLPALPDFSHFHRFFRCGSGSMTPEGDMRKGYFMAYNEDLCQYVTLRDLHKHIASGREVVSAMFVIPYPPGFPILVPGQAISKEILAFIEALDTREIHGYRPELGFRVFTDEALVESANVVASDAAPVRITEPKAA